MFSLTSEPLVWITSLLVVKHVHASSDACPEPNQWFEQQALCCVPLTCDPGSYAEFCTKEDPSTSHCIPCPHGQFRDYPSTLGRYEDCKIQNKCDEENMFIGIPGNERTDNLCHCERGYKLSDDKTRCEALTTENPFGSTESYTDLKPGGSTRGVVVGIVVAVIVIVIIIAVVVIIHRKKLLCKKKKEKDSDKEVDDTDKSGDNDHQRRIWKPAEPTTHLQSIHVDSVHGPHSKNHEAEPMIIIGKGNS